MFTLRKKERDEKLFSGEDSKFKTNILKYIINVEFNENVFLVYAPELKTTRLEKAFFEIEKNEPVKSIK